MSNEMEFQRYLARRDGASANRVGDETISQVVDALDLTGITGFVKNEAHERAKTTNFNDLYAARGYDMYGQAILCPFCARGLPHPGGNLLEALDEMADALDDIEAVTAPRRYCGSCGAWNYDYPASCPICEADRMFPVNATRNETYCVLCGVKSRTFECQDCANRRKV